MELAGVEDALRLEGRTAIVTGGGTGIGAASASLLAHFGCDVVLTSRKIENCSRVAQEIAEATGREAVPIGVDVRDEGSCRAMVDEAAAALGHVDILVNNAGGSYMFPFLETDMSRYDNNMALNLRGCYLLTQLVAPLMIERRGGSIVNISSSAGMTGVRGGAVYSAAKAGLQMLTRVVAAELGPKGVRCNAIAVGAVASEGALRSWERFGMDPASAGARVPLRRVGYPIDIAWAVYFLCSDMASWISGQTLPVDGGPQLGGGLPEED